jgi:hypothetical protein
LVRGEGIRGQQAPEVVGAREGLGVLGLSMVLGSRPGSRPGQALRGDDGGAGSRLGVWGFGGIERLGVGSQGWQGALG